MKLNLLMMESSLTDANQAVVSSKRLCVFCLWFATSIDPPGVGLLLGAIKRRAADGPLFQNATLFLNIVSEILLIDGGNSIEGLLKSFLT